MNLKLSKRLLTLCLTSSLIFIPHNTYADNFKFVNDSNYEEWFDYENNSDYIDDIYNEIINNEVLSYLIENTDYNVRIVNEEDKIEKEFNFDKKILALTDPSTRTIYIEGFKRNVKNRLKDKKNIKGMNDDELCKRMVISTLYHEFGHIFDYYMGKYEYINGDQLFLRFISFRSDFISIYHEEMESFKNTKGFTLENNYVLDNINSSTEYFAQVFMTYFIYSDELKEYCPKTYNYLNNEIKNLFNTKSEYFERINTK